MNKVTPRLVSTIIPVYNRPRMILQAVDSVLAQNYRPVEIIIIDDGSTDNTPKVVDQIAAENSDIIRVIHKDNEGPGLAREAGRLAARGEFIQYLDSDDWLLPNKFSMQVKALIDHPESGIAYGISRLVDTKGNIIKEPSKWTGHKFEYLFPALLMDRWWHTHTPLYRRSVSDAAGAWSRRRPEDWDLEARMGAMNIKLIYCEKTVSCHRDHPSENRVTRGQIESYLWDETWFLPRLYQCAWKAGVKPDAPEMQHFSRWAFMRARDLGAMGEIKTAWELFGLAEKSSFQTDWSMKLVKLAAKSIGWQLTGTFCRMRDRLRFSTKEPK